MELPQGAGQSEANFTMRLVYNKMLKETSLNISNRNTFGRVFILSVVLALIFYDNPGIKLLLPRSV